MKLSYIELVQIDKLCLKTVRMLFPLHREALTAYLSPIFGQYAVKNTEFINEFVTCFNISTNNSFKSVLNVGEAEAGGSLSKEEIFVPLLVKLYKGGKFKIKVITPSIGFLYSSCFKKRRRIYKRFFNKNIPILVRNFKKLLQITFLKNEEFGVELVSSAEHDNNSKVLIDTYKGIRNALHQRN